MKEVWADIVGFEGRYQISIEGCIRSFVFRRKDVSTPWRTVKTHKDKDGYDRVALCPRRGIKRMYLLHRLLWETFKGSIPEKYTIDHIDSDKSNNSLENLRLATIQQQNWHQPISSKNTVSAYRGLNFRRDTGRSKRWSARIMINGKRIFLGWFHTEEEAAKAYNTAALKYFGEFATYNEVN